jgi:hypothetical protein
MRNYRINILLSALLVFNFVGAQSSFAEVDPFPGVSTGAEIPGSKIWSQPGVTQSQWESTDTYKAFSCPSGAGNGMGVDMNFTTSNSDDRWFAYCVKTWRPSVDINADANFRSAQDAAIAAATTESQAWNAANPGKQKCIEWGPIVHSNGVSTASGGVCANVVPPGSSTTVESQDAPAVEGPSVVPDAVSPIEETPVTETPADTNPELANEGNGKPFTRVLPGQLSTSECPVGFQAANGIIVAIGKGTYTECWPKNAWQAWQLGGSTWEQFKSSGGTFNVQAVIDLNNAIATIKVEAKRVAEAAAASTPGIQRCSKWSGYGQSGQECAYAFVTPDSGSINANHSNSESQTASSSQGSDTSTVLISPSETSTVTVQNSETQTVISTTSETATVLAEVVPESTTVTTAIDPTSVKVSESSSGSSQLGLTTISVEGTTKEIAKLIPKVITKASEQKSLSTILAKLDAIRTVTYGKNQALPTERNIEETVISLTPDICVVKGTRVVSIKAGTCTFSYELIGVSGNSFTIEKQIVFKK